MPGRVTITGIERRDECRRERQVRSLLPLHSCCQLLGGRSLLSVEQEELLGSKGREQEQNHAPGGDLTTGIDQERRHWDIERQRDEGGARDLRDLAQRHPAQSCGHRTESQVANLLDDRRARHRRHNWPKAVRARRINFERDDARAAGGDRTRRRPRQPARIRRAKVAQEACDAHDDRRQAAHRSRPRGRSGETRPIQPPATSVGRFASRR